MFFNRRGRHGVFDDRFGLFQEVFGGPSALVPHRSMNEDLERAMAIPHDDKWSDFVVKEHEPHPVQGQYRSEMSVMTTTYDGHGQPRTTKYLQSTSGDADRQIRQTTQAYSDSLSGKERMALERHIGEQGRRIFTERDRNTGVENRFENMRGLEEKDVGSFDQKWTDKVNEIHQARLRLHGGRQNETQRIEDRRH